LNMSDELNIDWGGDGQLQVLTFDMHGETFAIEASLVREILDRIPETDVPGSDPLFGSVINFRGRVIPLADLHLAFELTRADITDDSRVIVIEFEMEGESCLVGLKADKVNEVTTLERESSEAAPRIGMRWRQDFIRCLTKRNNDYIVVPDLEHIFAERSRTGKPAAVSFTQH
jgi:purine-binding chemotaxis protein CheW